jgi:hypothetical protein
LEPDGTIGASYTENPATSALYRERMWRFMSDSSSPMSLWTPAFRAAGIGWTLHMQGRCWLESSWYREIEARLNSCWFLDAMIGDGARTIAHVNLTRPRSTCPFAVDDVQILDRLRPWLGHALRRSLLADAQFEEQDQPGAGAPVLSGQMILTPDAKLVFQTKGLDFLLKRVLEREPANYTHHVPARERLPEPIWKLVRRLDGAASGALGPPPRTQIPTAHGIVTLEAKWLVAADAIPEDVAKDPKCCLIAVTIELREHAIAHAARILRESGATPAQVRVGVGLALGKTKAMIADELGNKLSSVADQAKRLYQTLDVHNSAELSAKIWLGRLKSETYQTRLAGWAIETNAAIRRHAGATARLR